MTDPFDQLPPSCPTLHQLKAAQRVGQILSSTPAVVEQVREAYLRLPSDGVFGFSDFMSGERILLLAGIAVASERRIWLDASATPPAVSPGPIPLDLLLSSYLSEVTPPWLGAATHGDSVWWDRIPPGEAAGLEAAFPDSEERERLLLQLAQRFDDGVLQRLGGMGEEAVVSEWKAVLRSNGRSDLEDRVVLLSRVSDQLGYDVRAPAMDGSVRRVEVKTTASQGSPLRIFISRNEARVGLGDEAWRLVICRRSNAGIEVIGWFPVEELRPHLPIDAIDGQWESAILLLSEEKIRRGLPL